MARQVPHHYERLQKFRFVRSGDPASGSIATIDRLIPPGEWARPEFPEYDVNLGNGQKLDVQEHELRPIVEELPHLDRDWISDVVVASAR